MIITRTPFRITLGGGGTDLPAYSSRYGGFVFSAGINKYMYICVNTPSDDLIRVKYSRSEEAKHLDDIRHDIAREALRLNGIASGIEIVSIADIAAGTGLGSSSCYSVGLLNALHAYRRDVITPAALAREACRLEIETLKAPVGVQDQHLAAFGGLTVLEIGTDGTVGVRRANVRDAVLDDLNRNMKMFSTHTQRDAGEILAEQGSSIRQERREVIEGMHRIKEIGHRILEAVEGGNLTEVGLLFDEHWECKKRLSAKMTNPHLDGIYRRAKEWGALGGKISGAGGAGYFLFYIEDHHGRFVERMEGLGLKAMRYRFDHEGSKVVLNMRDAT